MFKNYLTVAIRNFWRNKLFSVINVLGLSIGISASLVIFLIVYYEFSFDKFEKDGSHIYRVVMDLKHNGVDDHAASVIAPLGAAIQNEGSGVDEVVPVMQFQGDGTAKVSIPSGRHDKSQIFKHQPEIVFTDPGYFNIVPHHWLAGSPLLALQNPFAVVLTKSRAAQYFPGLPVSEIPGKELQYNDELTVTITGIVDDLREHTDFTSVEFISFATIAKTGLQNQFMMDVWNDWMSYSKLYLKLSKGTAPASTETLMNSLLAKYNKDANSTKNGMKLRLQPLCDIHFNTVYAGFGQRTAHRSTLYGLLAIAAFLLLLGCINFINLSTANASQRAKEIGIRKTIGGNKKQLVTQFLSETFLITLVATLVSILITPFLLRIFSDFMPAGVSLDIWREPSLVIFLVVLTLFVSFLAGLYPALVLSGFKTVMVLKNQAFSGSGQTRTAWLRKTLTVSQFVIAQFFVIATFMVSKQIHYALDRDLGYRKEAILNFETPFQKTVSREDAHLQHISLLNDIKAIPEVELASFGFLPPAYNGPAYGDIRYNDGKEEKKENVQIKWGDTNYIHVYRIKIVAGTNISGRDSVPECLINETYAAHLGFRHAEEALHKFLTINHKNVPIVGVMHDFNEQSIHSAVGPVVFRSSNSGSFVHIALKPQDAEGRTWPAAIAKLTYLFNHYYPESEFNYSFFDDTIGKFYKSEQQTSQLLKWATGLTILISCLGLLGLVVFTTNVRRKEIGIRKVMGASLANLVSILSRDFMALVLIAFVIAAPIAWWSAHKWLENYFYRTAISWWVFALSGGLMILVALLTLCIQTIRSAMANPVNSLRTE